MSEIINITVTEQLEEVNVTVTQINEQVAVTVTEMGIQGPQGPQGLPGNLDPNAILDGGIIF